MIHYQKKERIAELKRTGRYEEALTLLTEIIKETEKKAAKEHRSVDSWPYKEAAIVYRKLKDYEAEVAVLERFATQHHSYSKQARGLLKRMKRAYQLAGLLEKRDGCLIHVGYGVPVDELPMIVGTAAFVDLETTGFAGHDELIEIAIVLFRFNWVTGQVLGVVDSYVGLREPTVPISPGATRVHRITMADVRGKQLNKEKVIELCQRADFLIAHNAGFDRRFLCALYPELKGLTWACSMNGVKWKRKGFQSKGLQNLLADHGLTPNTAHRALADVMAALDLLSQIDPQRGEPYLLELLDSRTARSEQRVNRSEQPPIITVTPMVKSPQREGFWQRLIHWMMKR